MSHTPGPWHVEARGVNLTVIFAGSAKGTRASPCLIMDGDESEREANARLIAAAPDLLAACKDALFHLEGDSYCADIEIQACIAAIAKAEGK